MITEKNFYTLIVLFFVLQFATMWLGYDRLPQLSVVGDGPLIQDPALALARGQGMSAPSFAGMLNWENIYAHHPPVYLFVQSIMFRIFGFTPFALRSIGILSVMIYTCVSVLIMLKLHQMRLASLKPILIASVFIMFEPMTWYLGRWERMDSLMMVFAMTAFLLVIQGLDNIFKNRSGQCYVLMAAVLVGLSLATHIQAAALYVYFGMFMLAMLRHYRLRNLIYMGVIPPMVFLFLWGITYLDKSLEAFIQLKTIADTHSGGWLAAMSRFKFGHINTRSFLHYNPVATMVTISACVVGWVIVFRQVKSEKKVWDWVKKRENNLLTSLLVALTGALLLIVFLLGMNAKRFIMMVPFSMFLFVIVSEKISSKLQKKINILLIAASGVSVLVVASYLYILIVSWQSRSPDRYDAMVESVPKDAKVAAVSELWYAFQKRGQALRVIDYYGFRYDKIFWDTQPERLLDYDYAIMTEENALNQHLETGWDKNIVHVAGQKFAVYKNNNYEFDEQ